MLRALSTVGAFTLLSRVLGLMREMAVANFLGASIASEAFFAALRLPNMFRRIFGEGAFNTAFVPLFNKEMAEHGREEAAAFANNAFSWLATVLMIAMILIIPGMQWFARILVWGYGPEKYALTVACARIMFSYLLFIALSAQLSGLLNSLGRFSMPAFSPVLLNVLLLIALLVVVPMAHMHGDLPAIALLLSWAVLAAGFAQLALLWISCRRNGMPVRYRRPRMTPRIRRLLIIMGPAVGTAGVQQINTLIATQIASVQDKAVSFLGYADRLYQLPNGLIGAAFGVVLLPHISRLVKSGKDLEAKKSIADGILLSMLFTLPCAAALAAAAEPFVATLFQRGRFTPETTAAVATAVRAYSIGLPAFVLTKVLLPGFFARENTRTPMIFAAITVTVDLIFALTLFQFFGFVGVAAATSIASWVNVGLLAWSLRGYLALPRSLMIRLAKILGASLLMAAGLWAAASAGGEWWKGTEWQKWLATSGLIFGGGLLYAVVVLALKATTLRELRTGFRS